jgi:hypothetical protein
MFTLYIPLDDEKLLSFYVCKGFTVISFDSKNITIEKKIKDFS